MLQRKVEDLNEYNEWTKEKRGNSYCSPLSRGILAKKFKNTEYFLIFFFLDNRLSNCVRRSKQQAEDSCVKCAIGNSKK